MFWVVKWMGYTYRVRRSVTSMYKGRLEKVFVFCTLFEVIWYDVANDDAANAGLLIVGWMLGPIEHLY
jgi:hypothetical protein